MRRALDGRRTGFTLIELLLVIIILAAIAGAAVATLETATGDQQVRLEDTQNRLNAIRTATLGPDGAALARGFCADVGRLPTGVLDLVVQPADIVPWASSSGLGWRGPYLRTLPGPSGPADLPDGWGNPFSFGVAPSTSPFLDTLVVTSLGSNGPPGDPFAQSVIATVTSDDWLVDLAGQTFSLTFAGAAPTALPTAALLFPNPQDLALDRGQDQVVVTLTAPTPPGTEFTATLPASVTLVPAGRRRLRIVDGSTIWFANVDLPARGGLPAAVRAAAP